MKLKGSLGVCLFVMVFLVSFSNGQDQTKLRKGSISVGGIYSMSNLGYSYNFQTPYLGETISFDDSLAGMKLPGYSVSAGYFLSRSLELFGGACYAKTGSHQGAVSFTVPNQYFYNDLATGTDLQNRSTSQLDLIIGLKYHLAPGSSLNPYIGFGGCHSSATLQFASDLGFSDTYSITYDDLGNLLDATHQVTIDSVDLQEAKLNAFGGFVLGGLELGVSSSITIYAEGLYKFVKQAVLEHPFSTAVGVPQNISFDMGGWTLSGGFRIYF